VLPWPSYLHFVVSGENSGENVSRYMQELLRECTERQCLRVLIEERLVGPRLGTLQGFSMVSSGSELNAEGDLMQFEETVAVNRAIPVRVFASVAAARGWVLGSALPTGPPPGGSTPRA
jgi:hypothetical protein